MAPGSRLRAAFARGVTAVPAALIGLGGIALLAAISPLLMDRAGGHTALALLLVVPVMATAVLGGRRPAWIVAGFATLALILLVPPVGTLTITFTEDSVAVVVFSIVAFTVGSVVAHRVHAMAQVDEQRRALLRSVSHDLRTPLAAIGAAATELEDVADGLVERTSADQRRMLEIVSSEADRLDRLVGNLLSMARIEASRLEPRRQPVDVDQMVSGVVARLERSAGTVDLSVDVPAGMPTLLADHALLDQALTNLVENAIRHSGPGGSVLVAAHVDEDRVTFSVSDSGSGVARADRDRIFDPFARGADAGAEGIGLAICKAVAEVHGGRISVGESPLDGASFALTIPIR